MQRTDASFALPTERGQDYILPEYERRSFVYHADPQENAVLAKLRELGILYFPKVETLSICSVSVPMDTMSLSTMNYPEQASTHGAYLGAYEIMAELGKFLKRIRRGLNALPELTLASFAIIPSEDAIVRLVPPIVMGAVLSPNIVASKLLASLQTVDPENSHEAQVEEFMRNYF